MNYPARAPVSQPPRYLQALAALGLLVAALGLALAPQRVWPMLLLVSYGLVCAGLAGGFFIALEYVTGASWCVAIRRVPEAMTAALPVGGAGILLILLFNPGLYPWLHEATEVNEALRFKHLWLSQPFFTARAVGYLLIWHLLIARLVKLSRLQDRSGEFELTRRNVRLSAAFLVVFGITFCLASFDWVMSLEPHWYSTIFGVYNFAGMFLSGLAIIAILVVWLRESGVLRDIVTSQHLLDIGRLIGAFSTFWAYIWFSQYMLIWYANLPEETSYFVHRLRPHWLPLFLLNLILNWLLPFLLLLPRAVKKNPHSLAGVSVIVLLGRVLDLYLMIVPTFAGNSPIFGLWELGVLAGGVALFVVLVRRALRQAALVPHGDPRLQASLDYH